MSVHGGGAGCSGVRAGGRGPWGGGEGALGGGGPQLRGCSGDSPSLRLTIGRLALETLFFVVNSDGMLDAVEINSLRWEATKRHARAGGGVAPALHLPIPPELQLFLSHL